MQRYNDVHNCLTENELGYHELVKSKEVAPSKVFTYIHEDYYMPLPQGKKKTESLVASCLERLGVFGAPWAERAPARRSSDERAPGGRTPAPSEDRLFRSWSDLGDEDEPWSAMHVVLDNSDYNE